MCSGGSVTYWLATCARISKCPGSRPVTICRSEFCRVFFPFLCIHMYSLKNYKSKYKIEVKCMKEGNKRKESLGIRLLGISRKQWTYKKKLKVDV